MRATRPGTIQMAKNKQKVRRPRAETPKGFRDYFGTEVTERAAATRRRNRTRQGKDSR